MLSELVDRIVKLALPEVVKPPGEPDHVYRIVLPNGTHERIIAEPTPRNHRLASLADAVSFSAHYAKSGASGAVWYGEPGVTVILDDSSRRDRANYPFSLSAQFKSLRANQLANQTQRPLIDALRTVFADSLERQPGFLANIRNVKFKKNVGAESDVQHGKESIDRSVLMEMSGVNKIDEEIVLEVPVFENADIRFTQSVRCSVTINPEQESFSIRPIPGELEIAMAASLGTVKEMIVGGLDKNKVTWPLFCGAA